MGCRVGYSFRAETCKESDRACCLVGVEDCVVDGRGKMEGSAGVRGIYKKSAFVT